MLILLTFSCQIVLEKCEPLEILLFFYSFLGNKSFISSGLTFFSTVSFLRSNSYSLLQTKYINFSSNVGSGVSGLLPTSSDKSHLLFSRKPVSICQISQPSAICERLIKISLNTLSLKNSKNIGFPLVWAIVGLWTCNYSGEFQRD